MKNRFYLILIFAVIISAPVFAETITLEDEEERPAPLIAATAAVKPAATPAATAVVTKVIAKPVPKNTAVNTQAYVETASPATAPAKAVQPKNTATALPAATAKPSPTAAADDNQAEELKSKVEYIKKSLESALSANNDLAANLREMQSDIRRIEERSLEIKGMSQDMTDYKARLTALEEKYAKDKEVVDKAIGEMDKMKENFRQSVDKLDGWGDIMEVLKKGISNNELEIAKLKKTINDLKLKYGENDSNFITEISKWPYLGFVTLLLSIIALSVAVAK